MILPKYKTFFLIIFLLKPLLHTDVIADVVKPTLIEININTDETYTIEIRTSIEALLTGINAKYTNTKQSPNADQYDFLRKLSGPQLKEKFKPFKQQFLDLIQLSFDGKKSQIHFSKVDIPPPGYTKVPRTSLIVLTGNISRQTKSLTWYYPSKFGDNAVRVRQIDAKNKKWHWSSWQWLKDDQPSKPFLLDAIFTKVAFLETETTYLVSGFEHILPKGLDHILFILGLFLMSTKFKSLLWQVTMFTIAHSITLGLSISGYINLPENIVEPLIALSIAYVGIENIWHKNLRTSRLFIIFAFGLLHGLGFARVLMEFGMPEGDFITALISFNIGVEFGQLSIILCAYLLVSHWLKNKIWYRNRVIIPGSSLVAIIGLYWTYDRIIF